MTSATQPGSYKERVKAAAEEQIDPALTGGARRRALKAAATELEVLDWGEKPFKPTVQQRLGDLARVFVLVQLLVLVAWGIYDVFLETNIMLGFTVHIGHFVHFIGWHITNTDAWHKWQPDSFKRHGYRKILETVLAGVGGLSLGLNTLSAKALRRKNREPNRWDSFLMRLRIPTWNDDKYRAKKNLPPLSGKQSFCALTILPMLFALWLIILILHFSSGSLQGLTVNPVGPAWAQQLEDLVTGPVTYAVIGFLAAPLARYPAGPVVDDMQRVFALTWVIKGWTMRWYHRLVFTSLLQERIKRATAKGRTAAEFALGKRTKGSRVVPILALLAVVAFFAVGLYFRLFVA